MILYISTIIILSVLRKFSSACPFSSAVSFSSTCPNSKHWVDYLVHSSSLLYIGNVISSVAICSIQATIGGMVMAVSLVFLLDAATHQPSWTLSLPQSYLKLPVLVTFNYVAPATLYFLPNTYQNLIGLICLMTWCLLIVFPHTLVQKFLESKD